MFSPPVRKSGFCTAFNPLNFSTLSATAQSCIAAESAARSRFLLEPLSCHELYLQQKESP